jgi:hypothetical protein
MQNSNVRRPTREEPQVITQRHFLSDRQGKTFADVFDDPGSPFEEVLAFFSDAARQQRMEDSEIHHDRPPLAGVVRELEAEPAVCRFFATLHRRRSARLRQAIGVLVRMIMERRGWRTTGKKGSLGVRGSPDSRLPHHNTGGLSFWFLRAERYQLKKGMPFQSVRECRDDLIEGVTSEATARTAVNTPKPRRGQEGQKDP